MPVMVSVLACIIAAAAMSRMSSGSSGAVVLHHMVQIAGRLLRGGADVAQLSKVGRRCGRRCQLQQSANGILVEPLRCCSSRSRLRFIRWRSKVPLLSSMQVASMSGKNPQMST